VDQFSDGIYNLVSKKAVMRNANWIRRQAILNSAQVVYASQG
jgi:hypothetical protein